MSEPSRPANPAAPIGGRPPGRIGSVLALVVPAFWFLFGVYACHGALPYNPVSLPGEKQAAMGIWFPQGWCFFTKDPREDRLRVLKAGSDGSLQPALPEGAWPRGFAGFDRRTRGVWIEAGILFSAVPVDGWTECKGEPAQCLAEAEVSSTLGNPSPRPELCGRVGLVRQRVLPWAWAHARSRTKMPSKVLLVDVECTG